MNNALLRFAFDEKKGVEALTYIAEKWPRVTAFYAAKILFFAEKYHLNRYSRPIVADTFIAMPNGPVPSTLYDFIRGNLWNSGDPEAVRGAIAAHDYPHITALRKSDLSALSESDIECLDEAIDFCKPRKFGDLSHLTHQERAYKQAALNCPMSYDAMIDESEHREAILEEAREFAAYGFM